MRRIVRNRPPRLAFNGHRAEAVLFVNHSGVVDADNGVGSDWQEIGTNSNEGAIRPAIDIAKHYQEYRYLNAVCEWVPRVGPASSDAGGRISIAYIDNPEQMLAFQLLATNAERVAYVRAVGGCKTFNVWERYAYKVPLTRRRKIFNVNTTHPEVASRTAPEFDRSTQGLVIIAYEFITVSEITGGQFGQWRITSAAEFSGFNAVTLS